MAVLIMLMLKSLDQEYSDLGSREELKAAYAQKQKKVYKRMSLIFMHRQYKHIFTLLVNKKLPCNLF